MTTTAMHNSLSPHRAEQRNRVVLLRWRKRHPVAKLAAGLFAWVLVMNAAWVGACPTCMGAKGDPVNDHLGVAIMFLLAVVGGTVASVCLFFAMAARGAKRVQLMEDSLTASDREDMQHQFMKQTVSEVHHA